MAKKALNEMSFLDHLEELRWLLVRSTSAIIIMAIATYILNECFNNEGKMIDKNELAEQLQGEYPGAIVHNIYPQATSSLKIKNSQRYQPERLTWTD